MSRRSSLLGNVAANYLGPLLNGAVNLVLVAVLVRRLGVADYGVLLLAMTLLTIVALLDLGLGTAVVKHVAEYRAQGYMEALRQTTRNYLGFATLAGVVAALAFLLLARRLAVLFHVPANELEAATIVLRMMGLASLFLFPQVALNYLLQGWQRYDLTNALTVGTSLARGLLLGGVALAGGGLKPLAGVVVGTQALALMGAVWLARGALRELDLRAGWPERQVLKRLLGFGWATFFSDTATVWIRNLDVVLVSSLISVSAVAPYAVAGKVPLALTTWVWAGPGATLPWFAELQARGEREKMQRTFLLGMRLLLLPAIPLGAMLVVFAGPLLTVWVGPAFLPYAGLLQIFAVVFVADALRGLAVMALYGMGRPRSVFWMCAVQFASTLALIFLLAPRFGLLGVALAVALPALVINCTVLVPHACRRLGVGARAFFAQVFGSHLVPAAVFLAALVAVSRQIPVALPAVLASFLLGGVLYLLLYWFLGLKASERLGAWSFLQERLRGLRLAGASDRSA